MANLPMREYKEELMLRARNVKIVVTDCDGVLTDTGVYYSEQGEAMKRFSIRDGMGVERLRTLCGIETAIMTGEKSGSVVRRAEKLSIKHLFLSAKDKGPLLMQFLKEQGLEPKHLAYIGDDTNDLEALELAGLAACPCDAMSMAKQKAHYICSEKGGYGAFRDLAELIIFAKQSNNE
jgi:3-deoxy-D-manno-octulosonate 8-phosphate phosphatase (KDO 8-P phosphatase)